MKKALALLLPGVLFTSMLLSSMIVFGSGCVWRGGRGHHHHHHGRHRGW